MELNSIYMERKSKQLGEFKKYLESQFYDNNEIEIYISVILEGDPKLINTMFNKYNFDQKYKRYFILEDECKYYYDILEKHKDKIDDKIFQNIKSFLLEDNSDIDYQDILKLLVSTADTSNVEQIKFNNYDIMEIIEFMYYCSTHDTYEEESIKIENNTELEIIHEDDDEEYVKIVEKNEKLDLIDLKDMAENDDNEDDE